jgi:pseudaminic acid biosynthesis-associated methylase
MTARSLSAQEQFWQGEFGDEYAARNQAATTVAANTRLFAQLLSRTQHVGSVLELGCNIGMNLRALSALLPEAELSGVEINDVAADQLEAWGGATVHRGSLFDVPLPDAGFDLTFCKGVLIHIAPDLLLDAYDRLHRLSRRYVVVAEYYNPTPVEVSYRGHSERLFKRDFAGELLDRFDDLRLVDYGFAYHRDPAFPLDDITWFLMEKTSA